MGKKTIIIGGVAGGATTAARLRRRDEERDIILLERGEYISYANCGLPYYIGDVIKSRDALLLLTPEAMNKKFKIDVRTSNEVKQIFPDEKKIKIENLKTGESYEETYDDLVISTGSTPLKPPIPGIDSDKIFTLWSVPDTDRIKNFVIAQKPKTAAVIGAGFIGIEMAENLHANGIEVSVVEMQDQVLPPIDIEMANLVHENMTMNGVSLVLGDGVSSFEETIDGQTKIKLKSGNELVVDLVILSIGIRPNSELAREAGLALNERGGIIVDEYLKTSAESIYALGDVIQIENLITKEKGMIPLAGPANKQGRILADNLAGDHKVYDGTMGTAIAKAFDYDIGSTGLNEKQLKLMGKVKNTDYYSALINQKSHAGYYPGATPLTLKILFAPDGKIFGAQVVGQEGVDKHIDVIATVMRLGGTVSDLQTLELSYAPPFSSAKSPTNMLGFVAENMLRGMVTFSEWNEIDAIIADQVKKTQVTILDVTEDIEREIFKIPNSYHIPLGQLRERMGELDKNKEIIVYCAVGVRSYNAARTLMAEGFTNVKVLSGGTTFYKSMHYADHANIQKPVEAPTMVGANDQSEILPDKQVILNCQGLQCPGPIMKVFETMKTLQEGQVLEVSATDMGFSNDIQSWCRRTGNTYIRTERKDKVNYVYLKKGTGEVAQVQDKQVPVLDRKTLIVFSGDLDKVLASFIIANGALAMGKPVTMFFTFWGLNALRKSNGPKVKKSLIEAMFGMMMPKGSKKLKLSKMNMGGMGTAMMKKVMNDKNVDSLEELMKKAMDNGLKIVACTMSMDIMGIQKEELIDGIDYAGVASYLGDAEEGNINLFV